MRSKFLIPLLLCGFSISAAAQTTGDLSTTLDRADQMSQETSSHLAHLRVDKWKMDSDSKREASANAESLQRNLTSALPGIVAQVRANPNSLESTFKLYRTLVALYDVMAPLAATAMASGPKDDGNALITDSQNIDAVRRSLGERMAQLSAASDADLARMRQALVKAGPAASSKKIIVDDNEPTPTRSRKKAAKVAKNPSTGGNSGTPHP